MADTDGMTRREYTTMRIECPHGHARSWSSDDPAEKPALCCRDAVAYSTKVIEYRGREVRDQAEHAKAEVWWRWLAEQQHEQDAHMEQIFAGEVRRARRSQLSR